MTTQYQYELNEARRGYYCVVHEEGCYGGLRFQTLCVHDVNGAQVARMSSVNVSHKDLVALAELYVQMAHIDAIEGL